MQLIGLQDVRQIFILISKLASDKFRIFWTEVLLPQVEKNSSERMEFFLHFLMVGSALLGLASANESWHGFEDLI